MMMLSLFSLHVFFFSFGLLPPAWAQRTCVSSSSDVAPPPPHHLILDFPAPICCFSFSSQSFSGPRLLPVSTLALCAASHSYCGSIQCNILPLVPSQKCLNVRFSVPGEMLSTFLHNTQHTRLHVPSLSTLPPPSLTPKTRIRPVKTPPHSSSPPHHIK